MVCKTYFRFRISPYTMRDASINRAGPRSCWHVLLLHKICAIKHSAVKHQGQPSYILTANTVSKARLVTSAV